MEGFQIAWKKLKLAFLHQSFDSWSFDLKGQVIDIRIHKDINEI